MSERRRVALLVETSNEYARGILRGVARYLREAGPWSLHLDEHGRGAEPPPWLAGWRGDGVIARVENDSIAAAVVALGIPLVDVSAARLVPSAPWVETNDAEIARAAASHLVDRGFERLAFVGDARFNWSRWRAAAFRAFVEERGLVCEELVLQGEGESAEPQEALERFLRELREPVGVMACYDPIGRLVLDTCRRLDIAVPESIAVIGVDDDELLCELSGPPLSSVAPDAPRAGYRAAALLDRMMAGERIAAEPHLVDPLGISTRQSTDVLAIEDRDVARALNTIRKRACEGIQVDDVVAAVPLSRRALETRFRKVVGRSPHEEIVRVRMQRVRELLVGTDLPIATIARRTGFRHVEYLSVVFRREVGVAPSAYRARSAHGSDRGPG